MIHLTNVNILQFIYIMSYVTKHVFILKMCIMIFGLTLSHSYLHIVHQTNKQTALDSIIMEEALKQWHLVKSTHFYEVHLSPKSEDNLYFTH